MKRQIAAQFGIPLRPLQALQQQQDAEHGSSTAAAAAAAGTCGDGCAEGLEQQQQQQQQQVHMSSYKTGVAAPVTAVMLAHQARAAAIALLRCVELLFRKCVIGARGVMLA
jgi:Mrp family chromosome partitioning ATPase